MWPGHPFTPLAQRRVPLAITVSLGVLGALMLASLAQAQHFPMTLELSSGEVADFGVVHVDVDEEGGLLFEVEIDPSVVGERASLHHLYFNLEPPVDRMRIETLDTETRRPFRIHRSRRRLARSGARFDWKVDLGRHRPHKHSRRRPYSRDEAGMQQARFRISADRPLSLEDLLPLSTTRSGEVVQMALKLHAAGSPAGHRRYVGGVWEPPVVDPSSQTPQDPGLPDTSSLPPAPPGCRWLIDLLGGADPVLTCG